MHLILHTDGGSRGNPGPSAIGCALYDEHDNVITTASERIDDTTNNVAEYLGLLKGLQLARQHDATSLTVHMDSELIVKQLQGEYRVKAEHLQPYFAEVQRHLGGFERVTFTHVPREHPRQSLADALVNRALDSAGNRR